MGKIVAVMLVLMVVLATLGFTIVILYNELPREPVEMVSNTSDAEPIQIIDYGATPVFSERMRFSSTRLSFFIEPPCSDVRATSMREAFEIFHDKMDIISFYEIWEDSADIVVSCSDKYIELGDNLFAAGEGGPTNITNTSNFKTIQKGEIYLYKDQRCERPMVELHELLHVFGFDHNLDPKNIMYNISRCDQEVSQDMIDLINDLYSIKALPDARISELDVIKRGIYLDFNITILNEGLLGIDNISLTLFSGDEMIDVIYLDNIGVGFGRILRAGNLRLPSRNVDTIDFVVDYESVVEELDEGNNVVTMTVL